jgi:hypothetical protein
MNWAWFDGKMSIEQYEHEHPLDYLAIEKANGSAEEPEPAKEVAKEEEPAETTGSRK